MVVLLAGLPADALDGAPVAPGPAATGATEDDPGAGRGAAAAADAPPTLLT